MAIPTEALTAVSVNSLIDRLFVLVEALRAELEDARRDRDDLAKQLDQLELETTHNCFAISRLEAQAFADINRPEGCA